MKIRIEFTGLTKTLAQAGALELEMPKDATYRDLVRTLADKYPAMVGLIIDPDRENFLSSNMFIIDSNLEFPAMVLDEPLVDGQRMALMSVITGG